MFELKKPTYQSYEIIIGDTEHLKDDYFGIATGVGSSFDIFNRPDTVNDLRELLRPTPTRLRNP